MKPLKVILSGGGTGGHIFPAIAIADWLSAQERPTEILFVGAKGRMEMERVPRAGYPIEGLWISGIQRKLSIKNILLPLKIVSSLAQSNRLLRRFKPHIAIGTGGYAGGPLLYAAGRRGIPTLLQEQNSYPGITNRWLASRAHKICVAYPEMERYFPASKLIITGNPIRKDLQTIGVSPEQARQSFDLEQRATVLLLGGSLGSRRMNELMSATVEKFIEAGYNVLWQCGKLYANQYLQKHGALLGRRLFIAPFIYDMPGAFAAATVVISRAGATTLSELAAAAKPAVLIPSPNVAEDHQTKNAQSLAQDGAASVFVESGNNGEFYEVVQQLLARPQQLDRMAVNIKKRALPQATKHIGEEILKIVKT